MKVKYYDSESFSFDDSLNSQWITKDGKPAEGNDYVIETAGFVPLSVKFKQFEQNGYIARFNVDDFDSSDYNSLYADDVLIGPDDDQFDVADKIELFKQRKLELLQKKLAETNETKQSVAERSEVSQASKDKSEEVSVEEQETQK